jgi:hypothetical protein
MGSGASSSRNELSRLRQFVSPGCLEGSAASAARRAVESKRLIEILPVFLPRGAAVVVPHMGTFEAKLGPDGDQGFKGLGRG